MSYVLYLPQNDAFKTHFALSSKRKNKDFYIVRPQSGSGNLPVVTVTPTQGDVARAKADIDRDREEHINEVYPALSHLASKRPRKNNSVKSTKRKK